MKVQTVFPANGFTWARVARGSQLAVPVPCVDLVLGPRHLRYYPTAATQRDAEGRPAYTSVQWRRYLVEDVTAERDLPLFTRRHADAHAVAESYARAVLREGLDPINPVAVSRWTLALAERNPDLVEVIREWLVLPPAPDAPTA